MISDTPCHDFSARSLLFVAGATPARFAKARASGADMVCIDLEDAVPADAKAAARAAALDALRDDAAFAVRINPVTTLTGLQDLLALADTGVLPAAVLVPKVESPDELAIIRGALGPQVALIPLVETPLGLRRTAEIAAAPGVLAMMFGGGDMAAELGTAIAWEPLFVARGSFLLGCAQSGKPAIDVPYVGLEDIDGLAEETRRARALGFVAKAAIHPSQVAIITQTMQPSIADIAQARDASAAFAAAGGRAVRFGGTMLEEPVMRRYRRVLAQAEQAREENDA